MGLGRRQVLAVVGAAGTGALGFGYWQRRRLERFPVIRDFRAIAEIEVPKVEDDPVITVSLLASAYDRAVDRFDEIELRLEPPLERYSEEFVEELREQLTDRAPDNVTVSSHVSPSGAPAMYAARRQALAMYRIGRSRLVSVLAHDSPAELPPERFEEQSKSVHERLDSLTVPYRGATLGEAIVAGATIESTLGTAESHLGRASEEDDEPARWQHLERATAASEDAEDFVQARDGSDYGDELSTTAERLVDEYEHRLAEAPDTLVKDASTSEEPVPSFTNNAIVYLNQSMRILGAAHYAGSGLFRDGTYGRAAHTHALLLPTVPLYEAFADIPQENRWEEHNYELGATPEDLRKEKTATLDAVDPYLDASNPLTTHLAAVPLGVVRNADSRVETLTEDANTLDDSEWARQRDLALLTYESARRYAEAIDETLDIVTAGEK